MKHKKFMLSPIAAIEMWGVPCWIPEYIEAAFMHQGHLYYLVKWKGSGFSWLIGVSPLLRSDLITEFWATQRLRLLASTAMLFALEE